MSFVCHLTLFPNFCLFPLVSADSQGRIWRHEVGRCGDDDGHLEGIYDSSVTAIIARVRDMVAAVAIERSPMVVMAYLW